MAEVVQMPRRVRDDLVWVCNCGCTTHYHLDNGDVKCGACDNIASISGDGWRAKFPDPVVGEERGLGTDNFKISHLNDAPGWLKRQIKDASEMCASVIVFSDGSLSTWRDDDKAPEGREWLICRLREALARLE